MKNPKLIERLKAVIDNVVGSNYAQVEKQSLDPEWEDCHVCGFPFNRTASPSGHACPVDRDQARRFLRERDKLNIIKDGTIAHDIAVWAVRDALSIAARDAREAEMYRHVRATTTAIRNDDGEKLECTPAEFDAAVLAGMIARKESK